MSIFDCDEQEKSNIVFFTGYVDDYSWIDELASTIDDYLKSVILPDSMLRELSDISLSLTELYNETCYWEQ